MGIFMSKLELTVQLNRETNSNKVVICTVDLIGLKCQYHVCNAIDGPGEKGFIFVETGKGNERNSATSGGDGWNGNDKNFGSNATRSGASGTRNDVNGGNRNFIVPQIRQKCHEGRHTGKNSPKMPNTGGTGSNNGNGSSTKTCHRCKEPGNLIRDCPQRTFQKKCYK